VRRLQLPYSIKEAFMNADAIQEWYTRALLPAIRAEGSPVPDEADLPAGGLALLSADTDRTQQFVFQSARLPEIRGASMRLDALNHDDLPQILRDNGLPAENILHAPAPGCVIYCGGGGLLALVPRNLAPRLIEAIEALYPRTTDIATITAVAQPITVAEARGLLPAALQPESLRRRQAALPPAMQARLADSVNLQAAPRIMRRQAFTLRVHKQAKTHLPHVETDPHARLCQSCGRRPAVAIEAGIPGEAPRYLCRVCHRNGKHGRENKSSWNRRFEIWCSQNRNVAVEAPKADDLQTIGKESKRYIGYIYADGNRIGKLLEQTGSLRDYSRLSAKLARATEQAVYAALFDNLVQNGLAQPFEIITIGGDDVLLIVPAHAALPLARDICAAFGRQMASPDGAETSPSMSAGVVIAQESNPIYFIHDLAQQLLRSAKQGRPQQSGSFLDFMVLKSQSTLATSLKDVRRSPYLRVTQEQTQERCLLTARPYALADVDKLLRSVKRLREVNFARGQLHQMRREFQNGRFPGLFYYLYQRERLHALTFKEIETEWGMVEQNDGAPPWIALPQISPDGYREFITPWLDMLELSEFVA
jgi:CRISPR-associated protein Cmr2